MAHETLKFQQNIKDILEDFNYNFQVQKLTISTNLMLKCRNFRFNVFVCRNFALFVA